MPPTDDAAEMEELLDLEPGELDEEPITLIATRAIEVRDREHREIVGRIIPYGEAITIRGRREAFAPGALAGIRPEDIRLLYQHDQTRPVGRAIALEEREDGAYAVFRVSRTALGDEALELSADGVLSLSPGFIPGLQDRDGTHRRLRALPEVSLVTFAAYRGAQVLAVRTQTPEEETHTMPEPTTTTEPAADFSAMERRMEEMNAAIERLSTIASAPRPGARTLRGLQPLDWFRAELDRVAGRMERRHALEAAFEELQTRALEDITGEFPEATPADDISGLVVQEFIASQMVNVLDSRRHLFARLGRFPMPRSGYAKIPVVTQHTEVAARTAQKAEANSRKMIVTTESFEADWFDGAVDIALEVIRSAELPVVEMVWNDLLSQYAIATEAGAVAAIEAGIVGATYTGTPLDTTDYAGFAADVATQAIEVQEGSGAPATALAVTKTQWPVLVAMVDASDRRQFAPIGATNADASVGFTATSFTLPGGIEVFYAPGLTAAVLFNQESLKAADGGPERVEATNVTLMGHDLGILGRTMFVPRIPAGVVVFGADPNAS